MESNSSSYRLSSSPRSSEGLDSRHGSPETKVTAFSPEDTHTPKKSARGTAGASQGPPAFSLEQTHYQLPSYLKSPKSSEPVTLKQPGQKSQGGACKDPFLITDTLKANFQGTQDQKLSPTASTFTPLAGTRNWSGTFGPSSSSSSGSNSSGVGLQTSAPAVDTLGGDPALQQFLKSLTIGPSQVQAIGHPTSVLGNGTGNTLLPSPPTSGVDLDKELHVIRALNIYNVGKQLRAQILNEFFNEQQFPSLQGIVLIDLLLAGSIYLGFANVRDCEAAVVKSRAHRPEWIVEYVSPGVFVQKLNAWNAALSDKEQRVMINAHFLGPLVAFRPEVIEQLLQELLTNYGELQDYQGLNVREPGLVRAVATFRGKKAAKAASQALDGFKIQNCQLSVNLGVETKSSSPTQNVRAMGVSPDNVIDLSSHAPLHGVPLMGIDPSFDSISLGPRPTALAEQHAVFTNGLGYTRLSPTGRSAIPLDDHPGNWAASYALGGPLTPRRRDRPGQFAPGFPGGRFYEDCFFPSALAPFDVHGTIGQERAQIRQPGFPMAPISPNRRSSMRMGGRQEHDYNSGHHNVVDVERIRHGLDVRTTIMLRNIPNKIDQAMLKEIVDETSAGKYDFMYLRIDFANNCNVGYAFINFEDPYFIIDFVEARAGFRWNRFNSDKVAEVSYATIQGKDCLVQKFRNSSVMLEHPSFRPKIFHTGNGPLAGTEDTFPGPDNPSKMRRSVENAEHVGLFAPRAGQHNRDEQRRRRSQYDRGTRLAAMEEAYEAHTRDEDIYSFRHHAGVEPHRFAHRAHRFELQY